MKSIKIKLIPGKSFVCRLCSDVQQLLFPSVRQHEHKASDVFRHKRKQIFNSTDYSHINCSAKIRIDHVRNEEVLLMVNEQRNILREIRKRKANWIGHILRRNCLLKQDKIIWVAVNI